MKAVQRLSTALGAILLAVCLGCSGGVSGGGDGPAAGQEDLYAARVQPIVDQSCSCHTADDPKGGYVLKGAPYASMQSQGLVVPGNAAGSTLLYSMSSGGVNPYYRDPGQVDTIAAWIDAGAAQYGAADDLPEDSGPSFAGIDNCAVCHAGHAAAPVYEWLAGPHGNLEDVDPATHAQSAANGLDSQGFPYYGYSGLGEDPPEGEPGCSIVCHDQLGDGELLTEELTGNVPRPVVGCESCHGPGSDHNGSGPIPFARPDAGRCGQCHNEAFDHNKYHPEGDNVLEDYQASPHSRSVNSHVFDGDSETDARARCAKCHTDEGARRFKKVDGGYEALGEALPSDLAPVANATAVQCRTCHDPHQPKKLLEDERVDESDPDRVLESAEFRTCTNCHQTEDGYHGESGSRAWSGKEVGVGTFTSGDRIIYDTHSDDPATMGVEGYIVDPADPRACRNCHNQHAADNTINNQWARSGHGGRIALAKEEGALTEGPGAAEAVFAAAVTDDFGPAWAHYAWTAEYRSSCARCHTATGAAAYLEKTAALNKELAADPAYDLEADPKGLVYDPKADIEYANGAMSHVAFVTLDGAGEVVYDSATREDNLAGIQKELLYCWACHKDNAGGLRAPGPITPDYADTPFPDVGPSNICMACHVGRAAGVSITSSTKDFGNLSFVNSHYLSAGGTVFGATGYEFPGRDYANVAYFKHDKIGLEGAIEGVDTGSRGPCVSCHMGAPEGGKADHTFLPFQRGADGYFEALANPLCETCHYATADRDTTITPEVLNEQEEEYHAALQALEAQLGGSGFYFQPSHPYFFREPDTTESSLAVKDWALGGGNDVGKNNMGAAFNYNLLHHDPGGFAHNRYYVKRLIYDSIDWLDDNVLNDSVLETLDALPAETPYRDAAAAYLARIGR